MFANIQWALKALVFRDLILPAGLSMQLDCPVDPWYRPVGHGVHNAAVAKLNRPVGHAIWVALVDPNGQYEPAKHAPVHVDTDSPATAP